MAKAPFFHPHFWILILPISKSTLILLLWSFKNKLGSHKKLSLSRFYRPPNRKQLAWTIKTPNNIWDINIFIRDAPHHCKDLCKSADLNVCGTFFAFPLHHQRSESILRHKLFCKLSQEEKQERVTDNPLLYYCTPVSMILS